MMSDDNKLVDIRRFPGRSHDNRYIVLYCSASHARDDIFCLTPHVMRWSKYTYIFDLDSCTRYWEQQSVRLGISRVELYEKVLQAAFGEHVLAVCCSHPWQGLFFLNYIVDAGLQGIHDLSSLFNQKAYRNLTWKHWFNCVSVLAQHLEAIGTRHFNPPGLRTKMARMKRFVQRLDIAGPYEMEQAEVSAIARRYSGWLGRAWAWTFLPDEDNESMQSSGDSLGGFPWRPCRYHRAIRVDRHLDYPVSQWDMLEPLLKDDFDRLTRMRGWSRNDKVNNLHWYITLFNMDCVQVAIRFRNPYSLHDDGPDFKAALYQAYYAYMDMMQKLIQRDKDLDLPMEIPFVGWRLEITRRLHLPPTVMDMFSQYKTDTDHERILDLQNCLPNVIEHYVIAPDFMPDRLFRHKAPGEYQNYDFSLKQWEHVTLDRPLFYYSQPLPVEAPARQHVQFIERTASNWWQSENVQNLFRDYFRFKNGQGQYLWVFRDSAGEWYQHGVYS